MKSSLWIVIVLVSAMVGFLMGYSVSSYTGARNVPQATGNQVKSGDRASEGSAGYGAETGGYSGAKPGSPRATSKGSPRGKAPGY